MKTPKAKANYKKSEPHEPKVKKYLVEEMENLFKSVKKMERPKSNFIREERHP